MNVICDVDPQGVDATLLLREAAIEARALYPDLQSEGAPWPTNLPTPARGAYLVGYSSGVPVACGSLRPLSKAVAEVRRMYVLRSHRRQGWAQKVLQALEEVGIDLEYELLRLETGNRQLPAMSLYAGCGFKQIAPYGEYKNDPTSVCFEKRILTSSAA